ncbi:MAG: hypothetical protein J7L07_04300 [Candidatus Odinarchaeota archaeon]|nr:hypothetical protein [Candidatus Odinarchaeota archaeon]
MTYWVNVDFLTATCTIHREHCPFIIREETLGKGIGRYKHDGGWFEFGTLEEAESFCRKEKRCHKIRYCERCFY